MCIINKLIELKKEKKKKKKLLKSGFILCYSAKCAFGTAQNRKRVSARAAFTATPNEKDLFPLILG